MGTAMFDRGVIDQLEGMISSEEAELLFSLASQRRPGCIVEIGSWRGKSASAMALGAKTLPREKQPMVYCIEPHAEFTGIYGGQFGARDRIAFYRSMLAADCADGVALVNLPSAVAAKAWEMPVGMLFIDGDHSEDGVQDDIDAWTPFLADEAIVAFDDALDVNAGPAKMIARLLATGTYRKIDGVGKIVVLQKIRDEVSREKQRLTASARDEVAMRAERVGYPPNSVLKRLGYGSFVSPQRHYVYIETPKAACTSIKQMLIALEGATFDREAIPYQRETRLDMLVHQRRYVGMPTLLEISDIARDEILSGTGDWFVFGVVRNPYIRLVSVFENKVRLGEPGYAKLEARFGDRGPFDGPKAAFAAFVKEIIRDRDRRDSDEHFISQSRLLMTRLIPYTSIFRLEKISEMTAALRKHVVLRGATGPVELPRENASVSHPWRDYYDAESAGIVADVYAEDFAAFGYDVEDWRGGKSTVTSSDVNRRWRSEIVKRNAFINQMFDWMDELRER